MLKHLVALFFFANAVSEELLWVAFDKIPTLSLQSFDLTTQKTSILTDLAGPGLGAANTQAATGAAGLYIVAIQQPGAGGEWKPSDDCASSPFGKCLNGTVCCSDPEAKGKGAGACYR